MGYTYTGYAGAGSWTHRKYVSIPRTAISGNHTNFPILFKISGIGSGSLATGTDIIFTNGSTRYSHDLVSYNTYTGSAWIKIPSLIDQNGVTNAASFYMYYENIAGGNQLTVSGYKPSGTWDNGYRFVCHMMDSGGVASRLVDSTKYKIPMWKNSTTDLVMVKSFLGSAQKWRNDTTARISSNTSDAFTKFSGQITVEAIVSGNGIKDLYGYIIGFHNKPTDTNVHTAGLYVRSSDFLGYSISTNKTKYGTSLASSWWPNSPNVGNVELLSLSYLSGASGHNRFYIAGAPVVDVVESDSTSLVDKNNKGVYIGRHTSTSDFSYSGCIIGLRIANVARNRGWHKTSYKNISSLACNKVSTFFYVGSEETSTPTPPAGADTTSFFTISSHNATGAWDWGRAKLDTTFSPRAIKSDISGLAWNWGVVGGDAGFYIPSGNALCWNWCEENAGL